MKALTLKHPWPFAICYMGKRIENRSWHPPKSLIGQRVAIHGGVCPTGKTALTLIGMESRHLLHKFGVPKGFTNDIKLQDTILTGIVAVVTLAGVIKPTEGRVIAWYDGDGYGWELTDVIVLPESIPSKGAQGLWDLPAEIAQRLNDVALSAK